MTGCVIVRIEELTNNRCTNHDPEEKLKSKQKGSVVDAPLDSDVRWERNMPAVHIADADKVSLALQTAQAKIQKLEAEFAKMQTAPTNDNSGQPLSPHEE